MAHQSTIEHIFINREKKFAKISSQQQQINKLAVFFLFLWSENACQNKEALFLADFWKENIFFLSGNSPEIFFFVSSLAVNCSEIEAFFSW